MLKVYQLRRPVPCVPHRADAVLGAGHLDIRYYCIMRLGSAGIILISYGDRSFGKSKNDNSTIKDHWELICMGDTEATVDIMENSENWERVDGVGTL